MAYASVDDNMPEHPKIARLSDAAFRVYVTSICFCARNLTDGLILTAQAAKVGATKKIIGELTGAGRWDADAEGWRVHNYLKWNKSRADVMIFREKQRLAGLASGKARGSTSGSTKTQPVVQPVVQPNNEQSLNLNQTLNPPNPNPKPRRSAAAAAGARSRGGDPALAAVCAAYENEIGTLTPTVGDDIITELDEGTPADWIVKAIGEAARFNARRWSYVEGVLRRYKTEGPHDRPKPDATANAEQDRIDAEFEAAARKASRA